MSLYTEKNITRLLLETSDAVTAGSQVNTILTAANAGKYAILNRNSTTVTNLAAFGADDTIEIIKIIGLDNYHSSGRIRLGSIRRSSAIAGTAATGRVETIGYNGTSGSLDAIDYNDYMVTVALNNYYENLQNKPYQLFARYTSDGSCTQYEVAKNLAKQLNANVIPWPERPVRVKVRNSTAITVTNDFVDTVYAYKDSDSLTIAASATAGSYAAGTDLAVGDYIYIGTSGTSLTGFAEDVYKVISYTGTIDTGPIIIKLDRPFTGTTASYATGDNGMAVVPAASIGANYGLRIEAQAQVEWSQGNWNTPEYYDFSTLLSGFTTNTVALATAYVQGVNTYKQLANMEQQLQGNEGKKFRNAIPTPSFRADFVAASAVPTFWTTMIEFEDSQFIGVTGQNPKSLQAVILAFNTNTRINTFNGYLNTIPAAYWTAVGAAF